MLDLRLPTRTRKPRGEGITHVLDKGMGVHAVEDLIATAGSHIDIVKLGWGTAYVTAGVSEKLKRYQDAGIGVCFGGTLFECAYLQGKLDDYEGWLRDQGIRIVEISNGTVDFSLDEKLRLIERFAKSFSVLSEVGSKDASVVVAPYRWVEEIKATLRAGVFKVVTEGRESGTVGVFRASGEIREGLIEEIEHEIRVGDLIFEAPQKAQQVWFIKKFGANVNLGNIGHEDVISVETLRVGLRGDTLLSAQEQLGA
jgi:phosphosulfolactate synthase